MCRSETNERAKHSRDLTSPETNERVRRHTTTKNELHTTSTQQVQSGRGNTVAIKSEAHYFVIITEQYEQVYFRAGYSNGPFHCHVFQPFTYFATISFHSPLLISIFQVGYCMRIFDWAL
jgi:hypothetical protein